ncbi:hypothetical protein HX791_28140 [Pseudomonas costantinii]|nr:hypothetical protein [Pseudomonas costantinii]
MAIRLYAASGRAIVMEQVNVWGRMVLLVIAAGLGTETIGAPSPAVAPTPFDERQTLSEPGNGMGFASSPFQQAGVAQENQRWVF